MEVKYKIFPYPVIAKYLDDYVSCEFGINIDMKVEGKKLTFVEEYNLDNDELIMLLRAGKAQVISHFECSKTGLRKTFALEEGSNRFEIHESKLNGKLQICTFIVAINKIKDFSSQHFHEDFIGYTFDFDEGCILGVAEQIDYDIEKKFDEFTNTESIFSIVNNLNVEEANLLIDLNSNKIVIKVPSLVYSIYKNLSSNFQLRDLLNSMVIFPTLIYVLEEVSKLDEEDRYNSFSIYGWYKSLKKILKESFDITIDDNAFNNENIIELSQRLLDNPIINGFNKLFESSEQSPLED